LSKLGADVLSLNPYASTRQALTFNRHAHAADLSHLVQASRAQLGAVIDSDGEHLTLVDDSGHVLTDAEGLTALVALVVAQPPGPAGDRAVALPVAVSHTVEALCRRAGAPVEWSSLSTSGVMEAASRPGVRFGGSLDGGYVFPDFLPAFDAVATLVRVLALLAADRRPLSAVLGSLPAPSVVRQEVPTPWERRGLVMRTVLEAAEPADVVLVDGVKVRYDDGWVLVRPDPELPVIHVWAEAPSLADAGQRVADYAARISTSIKG
jgi:mannose-1-phosphate guanylyltransferase / phosphomannomutase